MLTVAEAEILDVLALARCFKIDFPRESISIWLISFNERVPHHSNE